VKEKKDKKTTGQKRPNPKSNHVFVTIVFFVVFLKNFPNNRSVRVRHLDLKNFRIHGSACSFADDRVGKIFQAL